MIEQLQAASSVLKYALEQYLSICLTISNRPGSMLTGSGISNAILTELETVASYESTLYHSKKLVTKLRNQCDKIVPIHLLPPEILTRIFSFAQTLECSLRPKSFTNNPLKNQPKLTVSLLHTCSYWRFIAIRSHALWTHIDLTPFGSNEEWLLDRAKTLDSRSGTLLLAVHVRMGLEKVSNCEHSALELCAFVARRARAIDLLATCSFRKAHTSIIGKLLSNCTPGKITRITIKYKAGTAHSRFIVAQDLETHLDDSLVVEASHQYLEKVLLHVDVLRLKGVYFRWTSQAYTGLVRLHLMGLDDDSITASQLARVLTASPRLRYFRFGAAIAEDEGGFQPSPVLLRHLKGLYLEPGDFIHHERVLRLIIPGSKPLRMSTIFWEHDIPPLTEGEHGSFFARSNVVQLHAVAPSPNEPLELSELLQALPRLKVLSLDGFSLEHDEEVTYQHIDGGSFPGSSLVELHLADSTLDRDVLDRIMEEYPITTITIDPETCSVFDVIGEIDKLIHYKPELEAILPGVKFVHRGDPNEEDWD